MITGVGFGVGFGVVGFSVGWGTMTTTRFGRKMSPMAFALAAMAFDTAPHSFEMGLLDVYVMVRGER